MNNSIRIQMMDSFAIYVDEKTKTDIAHKTPKGAALVQYLIANRNKSVPNYQLIASLWDQERSSNPENALKTLISRMRTIMNEVYPNLGRCIVSERGSYRWRSLDGMIIDLYDVEDALEAIDSYTDETDEKLVRATYRKLLSLYKGDLLQNAELNEWVLGQATNLHNRYMEAANRYIQFLKSREDYNEIVKAARNILEVDNFDDGVQMELMTALIKTNRTNDALAQYKHAMQMNYRYLGVQPSTDMLEFYKQITASNRSLDRSLETIRRELNENDEKKQAFYCEYVIFKEIYNLQMRNLERLGNTMFLGLIMIDSQEGTPMDSIKQDNIMQGLIEILKNNLRKGDTITQFSTNVVAMLLPIVNYSTGNMIMDRIKNVFYKQYPNSNVTYTYRIGPLGTDMN